MACLPQFTLPGYLQHVIQQRNNRHVIFADAVDYLFYRDALMAACIRYACRNMKGKGVRAHLLLI